MVFRYSVFICSPAVFRLDLCQVKIKGHKGNVFNLILLYCFLFLGCSTENNSEQYPLKHKALLASRYQTIETLKEFVLFEYTSDEEGHSTVSLQFGKEAPYLMSILTDDITEHDILAIRDGGVMDKALFAFQHPYAVRSREDLATIYMLARRRFHLFGEGDVAFYDFATTSVDHINSYPNACVFSKDSSEKGYINTFNHVTAQAFSTTLFSEELADFIGDVHERKNMPELTSGRFSKAQLRDSLNYPVDNYIDMLNNEIGQELGKMLKEKFQINATTVWTPLLLSTYLNEIQNHYAWSFGISMKPYNPTDELVVRFCKKLNAVLAGKNH